MPNSKVCQERERVRERSDDAAVKVSQGRMADGEGGELGTGSLVGVLRDYQGVQLYDPGGM
jgi:hypothetical protein